MTGWRYALIAVAAVLVATTGGCRSTQPEAAHVGPEATASVPSASEPVGYGPGARSVLPVSQILTPAGRQVELPGLRPQVLALSPDGRLLVTAGKTAELVVVDPASGEIRQRVSLPAEESREPAPSAAHELNPDRRGQVSFTGLQFSPDGRTLFMSNVQGSVKVFRVNADGRVEPSHSIPLPPTGLPRRQAPLPSGLAVSADGARLYVTMNLTNRLLEIDTGRGTVLRSFDVGVAPFDVVLTGGKAYVSNWGGRRPLEGDLTGPAGRGTLVRVDPVRHIASEGSLSIVDLMAGEAATDEVTEIRLGLHASGLALSPDGAWLAVANAGSDTVSLIDTRSDREVERISLRWQPPEYLGASPNALTFDAAGQRLYVCNGTHNAVAVVDVEPGASRLLGLIPVGWYPGAIVFDGPRARLHVANIKGIGSGRRTGPEESSKLNSHQYFGTLSLVPLPDEAELGAHTRQVLANCRRELIEGSQLPARPGQPPRPVPERVGEPSVFEHVVYIIKENRTYDQVLGDIAAGNGDTSLCVFPEFVTPNQHKMVREFVLLDNTYCSGILSADGHQWSTTAFATDYMERSFAGFPRSYPDGMERDDIDALAYAPSGFIWDLVLAHGKALRDYGEFAMPLTGWSDPQRPGRPQFADFYRDFVDGTQHTYARSEPAIESLRPHLNLSTIGWNMDVPDVYRAAHFLRDLERFEAEDGFPDLVIICLPNDHTSGTRPGSPTPAAQVADNDLAFGRIVEAISHSAFWPTTAIFAIEDDPQAGWDHVSGYRTTAYVVSPYTKRGEVIHTQYNQPGMLRTMELILGLPPMNQMDAAATPLYDCFVDTPDLRPFDAVPTNVPLDEMNPTPESILHPVLRRDALLSATLPLDEVDRCPEDVFNEILWRARKGPEAPYPVWAILPEAEREDLD